MRTARKSTSRKQIQFAPLHPLQLGRISEQSHQNLPNEGGDQLLSPGRSKSLGSAVDRALLKHAVDAELAVSKDRPHSAQLTRKVPSSAVDCVQPQAIDAVLLCLFTLLLMLCCYSSYVCLLKVLLSEAETHLRIHSFEDAALLCLCNLLLMLCCLSSSVCQRCCCLRHKPTSGSIALKMLCYDFCRTAVRHALTQGCWQAGTSCWATRAKQIQML